MQTSPSGQSRPLSHSSARGQPWPARSTHRLSPAMVIAQKQVWTLVHRALRTEQRPLSTAVLPWQLRSVAAAAGRRPSAAPPRAVRPPRRARAARRRVAPAARALASRSNRRSDPGRVLRLLVEIAPKHAEWRAVVAVDGREVAGVGPLALRAREDQQAVHEAASLAFPRSSAPCSPPVYTHFGCIASEARPVPDLSSTGGANRQSCVDRRKPNRWPLVHETIRSVSSRVQPASYP